MKKISIFLLLFFLTMFFGFSKSTGKFEVGFHYSYWSIDIIAPVVEGWTPDLENYDTEKGKINFDSNGNNYGFEFRFFPAGKNGSFSIGLSYERNNFKATAAGEYTDTNPDPIQYPGVDKLEASADGNIELFPHSFNLSLRWELWSKARVHPYIGFGFGIGTLKKGRIWYHAEVTAYKGALSETEEEEEEQTLKEALDPLKFFPIVHLNFGVRGEIYDNLYLLGEVAVYDGLIFRGGLAYRF